MSNNSRIQVAVMLKRLPTLEDYKAVHLCGGQDMKAAGDEIINALMPQFNDNLRVELQTNGYDWKREGNQSVIHFECDVEGFEGAWCLPADMFTIRDNFDLKD